MDRDVDGQADGEDRNHRAYYVPGLHRGLLLLEALAASRRPLSVTEIAKALTITRSSAFRLIYTLRHMGFIENDEGSKNVRLGSRVLSLGFSYLSSMTIIETAQPELNQLRDVTGITAHLGIRDGRDLLYLACAHSRSGFVSTINVGSRFPVHMTPMGWLLLSDLSPRRLAELFADDPFEPLTEHSPKALEALLHRVSTAGAQGVVVSRGMMEPGGSSIVAPVFRSDGKIAACIDISGPDSGFIEDNFERYKGEVLATAQRLSARLGYSARRSDADLDGVGGFA